MELTIKRGDIYYAELNPVIGSEQGGTRPVLIISNDIGNKHILMLLFSIDTIRLASAVSIPRFFLPKVYCIFTSNWVF